MRNPQFFINLLRFHEHSGFFRGSLRNSPRGPVMPRDVAASLPRHVAA